MADRFELDLVGPNENRSRDAYGVTHGASDLGLGFKYELPPRGRFVYGIDGLYTLPTGTGGFSSGGPTQTFNLDVSYSVSPALGLGTTLALSDSAGFSAASPAHDTSGVAVAARYGAFNPSFVVTVQPGGGYQFYAEVVGQTKVAPSAGGRLYTDFGVQKLFGPYLELDAEYGHDFAPALGTRFDYVGFGTGIRVR